MGVDRVRIITGSPTNSIADQLPAAIQEGGGKKLHLKTPFTEKQVSAILITFFMYFIFSGTFFGIGERIKIINIKNEWENMTAKDGNGLFHDSICSVYETHGIKKWNISKIAP